MGTSGRMSYGTGTSSIRSGADRRVACRYSPVVKRLVLSLEDSGVPADHVVELVNVSMQGCMILAGRRLRAARGQRIRLKAMGEFTTPAFEGHVLAVINPWLGKRTIRIRFLSPLAYQTFKLLVYGVEGVDMNRRDRPEYENDQFWR